MEKRIYVMFGRKDNKNRFAVCIMGAKKVVYSFTRNEDDVEEGRWTACNLALKSHAISKGDTCVFISPDKTIVGFLSGKYELLGQKGAVQDIFAYGKSQGIKIKARKPTKRPVEVGITLCKEMLSKSAKQVAYTEDVKQSILARYNEKTAMRFMEMAENLGTRQGTIDWVIEKGLKARNNPTRAELNIALYLLRKKVFFINQAPFYLFGSLYFADFYLPELSAIVEVDGGIHSNNKHLVTDTVRDYDFREAGLRVIRIPNDQVKDEEYLKRVLPV